MSGGRQPQPYCCIPSSCSLQGKCIGVEMAAGALMLMGLCLRGTPEGREMLQALPPSLGGMCIALF